MRTGSQHTGINSLPDLLRVLKPGERLCISVPARECGPRLSTAARASFGPGRRVVLVGTSDAPAEERKTHASLELLHTTSMEDALSRLRRGLSSATGVVIDATAPPARWQVSESRRLGFFTKASALFARRKVKSIWIIPPDYLSPEALSGVRRADRYFLSLLQAGSQLVAQFLSAPEVTEPEFFLPRRTRYAGVDFHFDKPIVPVTPAPARGGTEKLTDLLEEPFRLAFEEAHEGLIVFALEGGYRRPNRRACEILGYDDVSLSTVPLRALLPPGNSFGALRALHCLREKGRVAAEITLRRRSGKTVRAAVSASTFGDGMAVAIFRDVTGLSRGLDRLEHVEKELRDLFESSPHAQAIFVRRKLLYCNRAFRKLFHWVRIEPGQPLHLQELVGKQNLRSLSPLLGDGDGLRDDFRPEITVPVPGGATIELQVAGVPVTVDAKAGVALSFFDQTPVRAATRSLEKSEEKFRRILEQAPAPLSLVSDGKIILANRACASLFGYPSVSDLIGKEATLLAAERHRALVAEHTVHGRKGNGEPEIYEFSGVRPGGAPLRVEAQTIEAGLPGLPALLTYYREVTALRKGESETRRRIREYDFLDNLTRSVQGLEEVEGVLRAGLQTAMRWLGFESGAGFETKGSPGTLTMTVREALPEKIAATLREQPDGEGVTGFVAKTLEPLLLNVGDYPAHLPYRSLFASENLQTVLFVPLLAAERLCGLLLLCSARHHEALAGEQELLAAIGKQMGRAVDAASRLFEFRQREARYREAAERIADVLYRASATGAYVYVSPAVERLIGHSPAELYRNPDLWRSLVHPDDRVKYSGRIALQESGAQETALEYRILPRGKAAYRWVRESIRYVRSADGRVEAVHGVIGDITDLVQKAESLARSEELNRYVLESVQEGVVVYDRTLKCVEWNRAMEEITGISRARAVGRGALEEPVSLPVENLDSLLASALIGVSTAASDFVYASPVDGTSRSLWARYSPLRDKTGSVIGVVGTCTDLTQRKALEQELRQSEQVLRNVIDAMGDALLISDLEGRVMEVNREFSEATGYGRSEVLGVCFPYPWLIDEEMARFMAWIAALREKEDLRDFDMNWRRKDGHIVAISLNTTMLRNAAGEPVAMLNIARNISDRKRLATELAQKNRQIELLNRIISAANSTLDFDQMFDTIAAEVRNVLPADLVSVGLLSDDGASLIPLASRQADGGMPPSEGPIPLERTLSRLAIGRGGAVVIDDLKSRPRIPANALDAGEGFSTQVSIPVRLKDRIIGIFNIAGREEGAYSGEQLALLQPIADQIGAMVDRAQLFQTVSDDSKYIHNLLNSIESVVFTIDQNDCFREVNQTWREFARLMGREDLSDEEAVVGRSIREVIAIPSLMGELESVMPRLFEKSLESYSRDFQVVHPGGQTAFHLAVTPMVIHDRVTGLVFALTDITEITRTEEEIRRRNEELLALNAISTSINKSLRLDDVLEVAAAQVKDILGADAVIFYLNDELRKQLVLAHQIGIPDELAAEISLLDAVSSASGAAIREGRPLLIPRGVTGDARVTVAGRRVFEALGAQALGVIPLPSKDRVLGALDVIFAREHVFTEQEQRFLMLGGSQVGAAIENAQLYTEVQEQVHRITALYELGRGLTGVLDTGQLFDTVFREVEKSIPLDRIAYSSISGDGNRVTSEFFAEGGRITHASAPPGGKDLSLDPGSPIGRVVRDGQAYRGVGQEDESLLAVPMRLRGRVAGVLSVAKRKSDAYGVAHLRLLESIGNLTEIAFEKAMLYEDTVAKSIEIENRNKELDDFTYVVSHDLKEPLITIEGYSKIVLQDYADQLAGEAPAFLSSIVQSTARMKSLIEDLLTLSRLGRVSEPVEKVAMGGVIRETLQDIEFTLRQRNATVSVQPDLPEIRYNRSQLGTVFANLISNAVKFNTRPDPRVDIACKESEGEYEVSVRDNGIGIEKEHFDRIFLIFQRLVRSEEYAGTGAGLTIVKKIVERHGGRIRVASTPGEGSTFTFTIPKQQGTR